MDISEAKITKVAKRYVGSDCAVCRRARACQSVNERGMQTVTIDLPEDHYTIFKATRDGLPEIIVVNDALLAFRHTEVFAWHLRIRLDAKELAENGMPTPEESRALFEVGDRIEDVVLGGRISSGARNALFLARSTWNELRELHYCVHDPEIAHAALLALIEQGNHERHWDYEMKHDPQWGEAGWIFRLFPLANGQDA